MATSSLTVELVTPEKLVFSDTASMVVVPGTLGDFGVLPLHAPMISSIRNGVIVTEGRNSGDVSYFVAGGFAEVTGDRCTIIAEEAISLDKFSVTAAQERLNNAKFALSKAEDAVAKKRAEKELAIAEALLAQLTK